MKLVAHILLTVTLILVARQAQAQTPMQKGQILPSGTLSTKSAVTAVAFSPDSTVLAGGMTGNIALWNANTGEAMPSLTGFGSTVTALTFSPNSKILASASLWDDGKIRLWDVANATLQMTLDHGAPVTAIAFSADGRTLVSVGTAKYVRIWSTASGELRSQIAGLTFPATAVQWLPNTGFIQCAGGGLGKRAEQEPGETGAGGGTVAYETMGEYTVVSLAGEEIAYQLPIPGGTQFCSLSRDGTRLAMAGMGARTVTAGGAEKVEWNNNQVLLGRVGMSQRETGVLQAPIQTQSKVTSLGLNSMAWSSNGQILAWCSPNHVAVWSSNNPASPPVSLQQDKDPQNNTPLITGLGCLAFSADGQFLIAGDANPDANAKHGIQIWGIVQ